MEEQRFGLALALSDCPLLADSVEKVAVTPCRRQNHPLSEHGGKQRDGTVTGWTGAPVLLVQSGRARPAAQHLLCSIDQYLDLSELRAHLADFYSPIGRPSIDPELMVLMLVVGCCYGSMHRD